MVTPLDGAASPHPRRRRYLQDARQGRGEWRSVAPPATPASCARRVATRGKGCVGGVRACAPPPQAPSPGDFCAGVRGGCWRREERRGGAGRGGGSVLPAASALAKLWKGELVPPLSSSAATDCCPIILVRLLLGDSKTSMRFGEHDGSIGDDISSSNPRSRGRFWHASIVSKTPAREAQRRAEWVEDTERLLKLVVVACVS